MFFCLQTFALDSSQVSISNATGPYFILDSNSPCTSGPTASYIGVKVKNISSRTLKNVKVNMDSIVSISARVSCLSDSTLSLGNIPTGDSLTAYFYVKYPCNFSIATHLYVNVSNDSAGTISFFTTVTTISAISANAGGKIDYRGVSLSSILGGIITDTIVYEMGNINKINDIVSFSPNGDSLMKPDELVLVGSKIIASDLGSFISVGTKDQLFFILPANNNSFPSAPQVKIVYTYINRSTSFNIPLAPFAYNKSGTQNKYTSNYGDTSSALATQVSIPPATNLQPLSIVRTIRSAVTNSCDTVTYTVNIINSNSERVQFSQLKDSLPAGFSFIGVSTGSDIDTINTSFLPTTGDTGEIYFSGGVYVDSLAPFYSYIVLPNDTLTLVYTVKINCSYSDTSTQISKSTLFIGNYESVSDTAINCVDCSVAPLPVELLTFEARHQGYTNVIQWKTASEINNSHFILSRIMPNGETKFITQLLGNGNSNEVNTYSAEDGISIKDGSYDYFIYKLEQFDFDGNSSVYYTHVDMNKMQHNEIQVYPNPVTSNLNIGPVRKGEEITLILHDVFGRLIFEKTVMAESTQVNIQFSSIKTGLYILTCVKENETSQTFRIKCDSQLGYP